MALRILVFCYVIYVSLTHGQEVIRRTSNGDHLNGKNLDCGFYGARAVGTDTCFCGAGKSYFTNSTGASYCYSGRGQKELGCTLHNIEDKRNQIQIIDVGNPYVINMDSDKPTECAQAPKATGLKEWIDQAWVNMGEMRPAGGFNTRTEKDTDGTTRSIRGITLSPITNETVKAYLSGKLVRFDFKLCNNQPTCIIFKYPGNQAWNAPRPATTTTPNATTQASTTKGPTNEPSTGDDDDDEDLLIKILVPVCVIIFIIIFCTILYLCWRHKNSSKSSNEHFVGISPVPQPTVKQGHVNRGAIDISNPTAGDDE